MKNRPPPERCPVCDALVPRNAKACPDCGSCYESGWRTEEEEAEEDEEEEFDYDRWLAREEGRAPAPGRLHPMWKWAALLLVIILIVLFARGF
jgi:hypothetical protein